MVQLNCRPLQKAALAAGPLVLYRVEATFYFPTNTPDERCDTK